MAAGKGASEEHIRRDRGRARGQENKSGYECYFLIAPNWTIPTELGPMLTVKDTLRATVNLTYDGRVIKAYHGPKAHARFIHEVALLRLLEARGCGFVPRLLEADEKRLRIITTNCGARVEHLDAERARQLFAELEKFGVRHDDPEVRNVTYRQSDGRFCVIDFEFATPLRGFKPEASTCDAPLRRHGARPGR